MPVFLIQNQISYECDQCKTAHVIGVPIGSKLRAMKARIIDHHRENSPQCPRAFPLMTSRKSYNDFIKDNKTLHFRMGWRDADELALTAKERKTPMIIIG